VFHRGSAQCSGFRDDGARRGIKYGKRLASQATAPYVIEAYSDLERFRKSQDFSAHGEERYWREKGSFDGGYDLGKGIVLYHY